MYKNNFKRRDVDYSLYRTPVQKQKSEKKENYAHVFSEEEYRIRKIIKAIKSVCDAAGVEIEGRIVLKDSKTGKIWS